MNSQEIPLTLFVECGKRYGQNEERKVSDYYSGHAYPLHELDPSKVDFAGAIGFREERDGAEFVIWDEIPSATGENCIFEPERVLKILAGPREVGVWAAGLGDKMAVTAHAYLHSLGLNLFNPAVAFVALVLTRAAQLTSAAERETHWRGEQTHPQPHIQFAIRMWGFSLFPAWIRTRSTSQSS